MRDIKESVKKFQELPLEVVLTIDNDKVASILDELNKAHKVNLYSLLIFLCVGDMGEEEIPDYLKNELGVSDVAMKRIISDFKEMVLRKLEDRLSFLSKDFHRQISIEDEKDIAFNIFKKNIVEEINNNAVIISAVNVKIFGILSNELIFKKEIEKALYGNSEKITHKNFVLDGKAVKPSVGNWLKYFIKLKGTDIFDNVVLSSFMTKSENAKRLDEGEKKILYKILNIYRNIKFFPDSMPSDDGVDWEIIPLEREEVKSRASQLVHSQKKKGREALISELKGNIDNYAEGSLEREILEEESEKDQEHHKLLLLAKKYPEGSLERRAVEDEMAKLEK